MNWLKSIVFSALLYCLVLTYSYLYAGVFGFAQISEALAGTGGLLIGSSLALSGMSYFFNFLDGELKFRKQIGVSGYFFALGYSITLLMRFPGKYDILHPTFLLEAESVFGLIAMAILTTMAIVSINSAVKILGPVLWRRILRSGYIAYFLLIVRAYLVEGEIWSNWISTFDSLPPPRLILTIFAISVLILRFCMEVSLRIHRQNKPKPIVASQSEQASEPIQSPQSFPSATPLS